MGVLTLGSEQLLGLTSCTFELGHELCDRAATSHLIWGPDGEGAFACDRHAAMIEDLDDLYDIHPVNPCCNMPDTVIVWSADDEDGSCMWSMDYYALIDAQ